MFTDSKDQVKPCGHHYWIDCGCVRGEATVMPPEEAVRHYLEKVQYLQKENEALQKVNEDMGRRISDYIATIRVLTELAGHKWL